MDDMASAYDGPHTLIINRNDQNLGLAQHLNVASRLCNGDILILAAGDDVSHPRRAATIAQMFAICPTAFAVYSAFHDTTTTAIPSKTVHGVRKSAFEIMFGGGGRGKGATFAYRKTCFEWPRPIPGTILSEDKFLPFRASLLGDVFGLDAELVAYRKPPGRLGKRLKETEKTALKRPEHLEALRHELELACEDGAVSRLRVATLRAILAYRQATVAELRDRPRILRNVLRLLQRLGRNLMRGGLKVLKKRKTVHMAP